MRTPLVAGNWKMHGSLTVIQELLGGIIGGLGETGGHSASETAPEIAVFPPFPYLQNVSELLAGTPVVWGAQNLSEHASGAYTGEVAAAMLKDLGCRYVLVGHSERRALYGDSDERVAAKFQAAGLAGLIPVLCVGETLSEREQGITESVVGRQLDAVLDTAGIAGFEQAVVAYEPVWAIGTGRTATSDQAQAVHAWIRGKLAAADATIARRLRVLYGGSVKASNAAELFSMPDIDGGLVGGASLKAEEFLGIYEAAA
jgi:triosephosphate isomerase